MENRKEWIEKNRLESGRHVCIKNVRTAHIGKECVHFYTQDGKAYHIYQNEVELG